MFETLVHFEQQVRSAKSLELLKSLTDSLVRSLGFSCFTLFRPPAAVAGNAAILITTYPERWIGRMLEEGRHVDDPAHAAAARSIDGIRWKEIGQFISVSDRQRETLSLASGHGLDDGLTLPFRVPGIPSAMLSLAMPGSRAIEPATVLAAKLMGSILFAHAHRLSKSMPTRTDVVTLSPRQIDCIRLIAQGMSDKAIAAELGLSPQTVREYVEEARLRYGVKRRAQLIAAAIWDGQLLLQDFDPPLLHKPDR